MKLFAATLLSAALLAGVSLPAQAQSLLGGVIGGKGDNALVTLGSGDAGTSGLVNVGVGGQNQVLDARIGNGNVGSATVGSGGSSGVLDADIRLLDDNARIGVGIGGGNLVDLDVGIGGPGNDGGSGDNGNGNGPGSGNGGTGTGIAHTGSGDPACVGLSNSELERLLRTTRLDGSWNRASNVQIRPVAVCPEQRHWLAAALASTNLGPGLKSAIANDALLSASLSRSPYSADRVFAVQQSGGQLTIFVY
ncbi:hypothetical protein O9Z70_09690 [Devosia sp. YIM 151766]|uniref:hypothetical protein n=1 Tax=Devosia sp. YIM 151766 TaxID=3017325 RepID=UPI00255D0283|nr:hypothetical protein [Devosia sp. YIM 151766]WIY51759.1 hypothetical protein O9Z70_09690 [Devosia sp. YIM 151766]